MLQTLGLQIEQILHVRRDAVGFEGVFARALNEALNIFVEFQAIGDGIDIVQYWRCSGFWPGREYFLEVGFLG
ncbi:hypothetical protein D3C85_1083660 [compost metagenome]